LPILSANILRKEPDSLSEVVLRAGVRLFLGALSPRQYAT
jgi:hypothetical protein